MSFNIYCTAPQGRPGPDRGLQIPIRLVYMGFSSHASLVSIEGELSFAERVVSSGVRCLKVNFSGGPDLSIITKSNDTAGTLFAPLSREAIRYIDERRGRGDLGFTLSLRLKWQAADEEPPVAGGRVGFRLRPLTWNDQPPNWEPVPSSTWKRCLEQMEYDQREVVEIPKLPFSSDPALAEALRLLKAAEEHARDGDWRDVMTNCRNAFESMSRYQVPGRGNTKIGFERLFARTYPGPADAGRVEAVDAMTRQVRSFCDTFGPHVSVPPIDPTRAEALFALNTTASLLAMIGKGLSDAESERGNPKATMPSTV